MILVRNKRERIIKIYYNDKFVQYCKSELTFLLIRLHIKENNLKGYTCVWRKNGKTIINNIETDGTLTMTWCTDKFIYPYNIDKYILYITTLKKLRGI